MSTLTTSAVNAVRPTHAPGFTDLLRSEWTKFKTLRSTWWSLGAMVVVSLGISILLTSVFTAQYPTLHPSDKAAFRDDTVGLFLQPGAQLGELAATVLGVLLITSEYSTGMIRATALAAPRRTPVLLAKAAVLAGVVFVLAQAVGFVCFFAGSAIAGKHVTVTLATPGSLRAIIGFGLVLAMTALIALAIGALLRHSAAALSTALGLALVLPGLLSLVPGSLGRHLTYAMPQRAGQLIMDRTEEAGTPYGQWTGLGIVAIWTVALLGLALWSIKKRDV
jgi:ABC-type transport system involved in multi-copper enzyme maturation permease subunit